MKPSGGPLGKTARSTKNWQAPFLLVRFRKGIRKLGFGGFIVPGAGYVRVDHLLQAVQGLVRPQVDLIAADYSTSSQDGPVIHCEGWYGRMNPTLHGIPFRHAHGEVLTIECPDLDDQHILNTGLYLLPLGQHRFRAGATYDWDRLDPTPHPGWP